MRRALLLALALLALGAPTARADVPYGGSVLYKTSLGNGSISLTRHDNGRITGRINVAYHCKGYAVGIRDRPRQGLVQRHRVHRVRLDRHATRPDPAVAEGHARRPQRRRADDRTPATLPALHAAVRAADPERAGRWPRAAAAGLAVLRVQHPAGGRRAAAGVAASGLQRPRVRDLGGDLHLPAQLQVPGGQRHAVDDGQADGSFSRTENYTIRFSDAPTQR